MTETEFILIVTQNNVIRTNYVQAKTDNMQQNSKYKLCGDRDETINPIISECNKLAQKEYKTGYDRVGKVVHWELCKKLKFKHTNKLYMHKPGSFLINEKHKILWNFDMQTNHLIPARWPNLVMINKKKRKENLPTSELCCPDGPQNENQSKRKERQVLGPFQRTEKTMKHEGTPNNRLSQPIWNTKRLHFANLLIEYYRCEWKSYPKEEVTNMNT